MKYLALFLVSLSILSTQAQTEQDTVAIDSAQFDEVRSLLSFYKYMLNTVGAARTSTRDKEVIITESYKKIFSSENVQIEDDLILDRKVITNKDVNAYLRDVDFFFKEIRFEFDSIEVQRVPRGEDDFFFLASFESSIQGTTIEGDTLLDTKRRFIEVNLDQEASDLKIASVYSRKTSRTKELQNWWAELSFGWINIFKEYVEFDSVDNQVLLKIASIDSIDISGNQFILNIEPLTALRNLKSINLNNTKISDLSPLRYSRDLKILNASSSVIADITPLQYFETLSHLDLSNSEVESIATLSRLKELQHLDLSDTKIADFDPLAALSNLETVNISNTSFSKTEVLSANTSLKNIDLSRTSISTLTSFSSLSEISELNLSETEVESIAELDSHPNLQVLIINQTKVDSLDALMLAPKLKKVYADNTGITEQIASTFMTKKPGTVVVANSKQVLQWWSGLPDNWKSVFGEILGSSEPQQEELVKFLNRDSLDLSGNSLYEVEPLKRFRRLKYLNVSKNLFPSFEFTETMENLEFLEATGLPIETTLGLEKNLNLRFLILKGSLLKDIRPVSILSKLALIDADETGVDETIASQYLTNNPSTIVIYRSAKLKEWWEGLPFEWKKELSPEEVNSRFLHELTQRNQIAISNQAITSLAPLNVFTNLKSVSLDKVGISNLNELFIHKNLLELTCTNGPLQSLAGITKLRKLSSLDISNTAIEGLQQLDGLTSLKHLNCSGTGIKNLRGVEELTKMESINFSNTRIWKLERLYAMSTLSKLICNNTRLRDHTVEDFKTAFPDCEVTFY